MDVSVICVNWNSVAYLRKCIASIYRHTPGLAIEIIVVDNASSDRDVDNLPAEFPGIALIKSPENLGFARANNLGFEASSGEYVLFLNPDTELVGPAINLMVERIKSLPDAGVVGCKLLNTDGSVQTESIQKFPTILNQLLDVEYLRLRWPNCPLWRLGPLFRDGHDPVSVDVIPGACMFLRRKVFQDLGGFSTEYFMYAEDIDLNFKAASRGLRSFYIPEAAIIHHGGTSSTQHKVSQWSTIMKFRAMMTYYTKTRGGMYAWMYRVSLACVAVGRLALLGVVFPFARWSEKKDRIFWASAKWNAVLKCAVGIGNPAS